jgi:signal transduction histidine kinase
VTTHVLPSVITERSRRPDTGGIPVGVWHDLVHELATVRALTAAAILASDEMVRLDLLGLIEAESGEMSALLRTLRPGTETAELVDVGSVAREVIRPLRSTTLAELALLELEVGLVDMSRLSLRRILGNLVGNAVRAAGDGRVEVRVRSSEKGLGVIIEVADSGPGFGQGPTGLVSQGLSIVMELAAAAGGVIDIGKSDLGGAGVTVTLPASRPQ